jgi:hypothetical protein
MRRCLVMALVLLAPGAQGQTNGQSAFDLARSEFSLGKTGEVREPPSRGEDLEATIPAPAPEARSDERKAAPLPITPTPQPPPVFSAEVLALDSNMGQRVNDLLACRLEIAADRRVPNQRVTAGSLLLRWTVRPDGSVTSAEAVSMKDTDPDVSSCVQRKMSGWLFTRQRNAPEVRLQERIRF